MALISCHECGKQISDSAQSCPHCGAPLENGSVRETSSVSITAKVEMACSAVSILLLFVSWVNADGRNSPTIMEIYEHGRFPYIFIGVCLGNIILKFYKRSLWLSIFNAFLVGGVIVEVNKAVSQLRGWGASLSIWGILAILIEIVMIVSILIGILQWMKTSSKKTGKRLLWIALGGLGIGIISLFFVFISPYFIVPLSIGVWAFAIFGVLGGVIWLLHRNDSSEDYEEPTKEDGDAFNNDVVSETNEEGG